MIEVEVSETRVVLRMPEEFNFKLHSEFREGYRHQDPGLVYEVDLRRVVHMDSSALGMLLLLRSHCGEQRKAVCLTHCSPRILKILKTAKMDTCFDFA